jgi:hypothetical protein
MFTKISLTIMLTLLLTTVGFSAEPVKSGSPAGITAPVSSPALQTPAAPQSQSTAVAAPTQSTSTQTPVSGVPTKVKPNRAITITASSAESVVRE